MTIRPATQVLFLLSTLTVGVRPALASPINFVVDGGFESQAATYYTTGAIGAWAVSTPQSTAGIYNSSSFPGSNVTEGLQAFDMGMGGIATTHTLAQQLTTVAGRSYRLTFDWGSEYDWGTNSTVSIGNLVAQLVDQPFDSSNAQLESHPWIQHSASFDFVAAGNDILRFVDSSAAGNPGPFSHFAGLALDNISVVENATAAPVPEPASLLLVGLGLGLLGRAHHRRRDNSVS